MDNAQPIPDRSEAALPPEVNIGVGTNPFDASDHTTAQHILIGLTKIGIALRSQSWQDAGQQGLTPTQGQILSLLSDKGEAGLRLSDVAENLSVTAATASDAVSSLVEKGLVQKTRSSQDKRAIAITLTPEGKAAAVQTSTWSEFLLSTMDELSDAEQITLLRGLIKIIRKLQEQGQISVARMCVTCTFFRPYQHKDAERPHHCALVNAPFSDRNLRLNCPEYVAAESEVANRNWQLYLQ
ncbi:MAG: MarR family transcriptional regulator [Elainellaceae cyanobacterium]